MFFFFFFQAEDGIRDLTVTGVQTCALPISGERGKRRDQYILEDGHVPEELGDLKRPRDAARGDLVRAQAVHPLPLEPDLAGVGTVEAGEQVDRRRLARAVRTDHPANLAATER